MAIFSTVAIADLGAGRDAPITAAGLIGKTAFLAPQLLVLATRVTGTIATVRLHRRDSEMGLWIPSAVAAVILDPAVDGGLAELRYNCASIPGDYGLIQESGSGVVTFCWRLGF